SIAGARYYFPLVQGVIDIGAESSKAMKCAANGKIVDFAANDKCAGGAGIFLDTMSLLLQIDADDPKSMDMITEQINITSTCVVFAESEVVTLIHKGMNRFDIWRGINESIAERAFSLAARIRASGKVALIGGIAKNPVFVSCFEKMSGYKLLIPTNAQFVNALGAAIYARESKK
ncbi:MAG: acyl-CoA dehydratase activase, partial [Dehalococcoidia bacterium]